jgi:hypothetical protein
VSLGVDDGDSFQNVGTLNSVFTWLLTGGNFAALKLFCVRIGAVGHFGRYLISWECFSFQISPKIHYTQFEKIYTFLLLSA